MWGGEVKRKREREGRGEREREGEGGEKGKEGHTLAVVSLIRTVFLNHVRLEPHAMTSLHLNSLEDPSPNTVAPGFRALTNVKGTQINESITIHIYTHQGPLIQFYYSSLSDYPNAGIQNCHPMGDCNIHQKL